MCKVLDVKKRNRYSESQTMVKKGHKLLNKFLFFNTGSTKNRNTCSCFCLPSSALLTEVCTIHLLLYLRLEARTQLSQKYHKVCNKCCLLLCWPCVNILVASASWPVTVTVTLRTVTVTVTQDGSTCCFCTLCIATTTFGRPWPLLCCATTFGRKAISRAKDARLPISKASPLLTAGSVAWLTISVASNSSNNYSFAWPWPFARVTGHDALATSELSRNYRISLLLVRSNCFAYCFARRRPFAPISKAINCLCSLRCLLRLL